MRSAHRSVKSSDFFIIFSDPDAQRMASVPPLGAHVEKVPYKTVASLAAMEAEHARVLALGAEGLMVRCMTSTKYMPGRTQDSARLPLDLGVKSNVTPRFADLH